jgi:hypothetical protein
MLKINLPRFPTFNMVDPNGRCKENGINKSKRETFQLSQVQKNSLLMYLSVTKSAAWYPLFIVEYLTFAYYLLV